jgi:signal transduction histidine kinase/ActR/RegA family two-component response regulator
LPESVASSHLNPVRNAQTAPQVDWQQVINALPLGALIVGADGRVAQFNQQAARLLDLPEAWLSARPALDDMLRLQAERGDLGTDPERMAGLQRDNDAVLGDDAWTERTHIQTNRQGRRIEERSVRLPQGGMLRTYTDVTQQLHDQEALLEREATREQSETLAGVGTWRWRLGMDGLLQHGDFSAMAWRIFGGTTPLPADLCDESWLAQRLDPADRELERLTRLRALRGRDSYDLEVHLRPADAAERRVHLKGQVWITPDGHLDMVGVVQDVTERRQHEARLVQAEQTATQANRIKTQFLANVSHEMRTPLNAIQGMFTLLQTGHLNAEQQDYAHKGQTAALALQHLVDDLLDATRIETGQLRLDPAPCNLQDCVLRTQQLLTDQAAAKQLPLTLRTAPSPKVVADAHRLTQVLTILGSNAIKFTEHGEVQLGLETLSTPSESTVRVRFWVQDTGMGFDPERQQALKGLFTQGDTSATRVHGGLGLGLGIADHIVQLMNSHLTLDSTPGQGSRFWFDLTLPISHPDASASPSAASKRVLQGLRVLVVEDNPVNQLVIVKILKAQGAQVQLAHNGQEGVEAVNAATTPFDVVLMDLQMPVMDGWTAAKILRERHSEAELPIITVSANLMPDDIEACKAAGMSVQLGKPLHIPQLLKALQPLVRND